MDCSEPGVALRSLPLRREFWRSWNGSLDIRPCYTAGLCVGGTWVDAPHGARGGYCKGNNTGPFCEVCPPEFVKGEGGLCVECAATDPTATIALGSAFVAAVGTGAATPFHIWNLSCSKQFALLPCPHFRGASWLCLG